MICLALIDAIDEAGYLRADLAELAARLGTEIEDVEAVLGVVQGFDPLGVGARDLAECLTLQLKARDRFDPAMQALMTRLDLIARRDMAQLTQLCGVDAEDITDMIAEIRELNPKPGLAFGSEPVTPVVPDVFVRVGPDGAWLIELNTDTLPRLLVHNQYYAKVNKGARDKESKNYLARLPQQRQLADQEPGPARPHHSQSVKRDRAPAGFLSHPWRAPLAPTQSAHHSRRHPDA